MKEKTFDVKVLKAFTDKHTGKKYEKGDVIKGITKARFNEILKVGKLVEAIVVVAKKEEKE